MRKIFIYINLILIITSCSNIEEQSSIEGYVIVNKSIQEGVIITLNEEKSTTTDQNGYFKISRVENGTNTLSYSFVRNDSSYIRRVQPQRVNGMTSVDTVYLPGIPGLVIRNVTRDLEDFIIEFEFEFSKDSLFRLIELTRTTNENSIVGNTSTELLHTIASDTDTIASVNQDHSIEYEYYLSYSGPDIQGRSKGVTVVIDKPTRFNVFGYTVIGDSKAIGVQVDIDNIEFYKSESDSTGFFAIPEVETGEHILNFRLGLLGGSYSKESIKILLSDDLDLEQIEIPKPLIIDSISLVENLENISYTLKWNKIDHPDFLSYELYGSEQPNIDIANSEMLISYPNPNDTIHTLFIPFSSSKNLRVFAKHVDGGIISASNVFTIETDKPNNLTGIEIDSTYNFYLEAGSKFENTFQTEENTFYTVSWFDSWFSDYTANSIKVSCLNGSGDYFFKNNRLIQMIGSPMPIYAKSREEFSIEIEGYDNNTFGTFGVRINTLEMEQIEVNSAKTVDLSPGSFKLLEFVSTENREYTIKAASTVGGGAYGDGIATHLSILIEGSEKFIKYKEPLPHPCCGMPDWIVDPYEYKVTLDSNEKLYLLLDGAYWFSDNPVEISIE